MADDYCGQVRNHVVVLSGGIGGARPFGARAGGIAQLSKHMSQTWRRRTGNDARRLQPAHVRAMRWSGEAGSQHADRWHSAAAKWCADATRRFSLISSPDLLGHFEAFCIPRRSCSRFVVYLSKQHGSQACCSDRTRSIWGYFHRRTCAGTGV